MSELKDRIKEAAEEIGGLNKLAPAINVARRTLGGWVDGSNEPKAKAVAEISIVTGVAIKWLVLGVGPKFEDGFESKIGQSLRKDRAGDA